MHPVRSNTGCLCGGRTMWPDHELARVWAGAAIFLAISGVFWVPLTLKLIHLHRKHKNRLRLPSDWNRSKLRADS